MRRHLITALGLLLMIAVEDEPGALPLALVILGISYFSILISEMLAPYGLHERDSGFIYAPPSEGYYVKVE